MGILRSQDNKIKEKKREKKIRKEKIIGSKP